MLAPQAGIPVPSGVCSAAVVLKVGAPDQQHQHHLVKMQILRPQLRPTLSETLRAGLNNAF